LRICISQASIAMQVRCGGIFNNTITAHFPVNVPVNFVKEFWKSV